MKDRDAGLSAPSTRSAHPPSSSSASPAKPLARAWPPTVRQDLVEEIHGVKVADPYRWLEEEEADSVQAWMNDQDAFARAELDKLPGRAELSARLREVFYYDSISAPRHCKGRYFYSRKHSDKEKSVVYWRQGEDGSEVVLFDPNTWSSDGSKGLGGYWPSQDGIYVAYNVKENNADESVMHLVEVKTGRELPDVIAGTKYSAASWTPDSSGFYYTWIPPVEQVAEADRPGFAEVRFHELGRDPREDRIVRPATGNPQSFLGGFLSRDGRFLFAQVQHGWNSSDVYFQDLSESEPKWKTLVEGVAANFSVYPWRGKFYVHTNDGAPRYQVFVVDPDRSERASWRPLVAENDAPLESMNIVGEHLVLGYVRNAASEIVVHDLEGKRVRRLELPGLGTCEGIVGNPDEDTGYLAFSSFTEPSIVFRTSIREGSVHEWARVKLPIDTSKFATEQVFFASKDSTKVPMFIVRRKDIQKSGKNPTVLYGYGGFNVSMTPLFSSSRAVWMERGGIYAIANLRGGGEYGEDWHRDGMLGNKQNVFDDFLAAARYLIDEGWTSPEHLAIQGGSNGGLLVGAAMAQAPELFKAVVCSVPLLDMVRYHKFGSGMTWIPEYGSAENADQFHVLHAYSPYHCVKPGVPYPAMLMDSADHDDRVDPMHARKFTAQMQHATSGTGPVLLRIERNAGHGGADMVKQQVDRYTDVLSFLWDQLR